RYPDDVRLILLKRREPLEVTVAGHDLEPRAYDFFNGRRLLAARGKAVVASPVDRADRIRIHRRAIR
ncbi:MAG: hypothetical protein M3329_10135, partial [Pseudomonadota bacterium]|nr:hypothetical protein [Pseudomonadota bacterium]